MSTPDAETGDHRRTRKSRRSFRARAKLLMLLVAVLLLFLALFVAILGITMEGPVRENFFTLSLAHAGAGAILLLVRWAVLVLPSWRRHYNSPHRVRRREFFRNRHRPAQEKVLARDNGSILIPVLAILGLIAALLVHLVNQATALRLTSESLHTATELRMASLEAAREALRRIASDDPGVDSNDDLWAAPTSWTDPNGVSVLTRITDEDRLFDLNNLAVTTTGNTTTPEDILHRLLMRCGIFSTADMVAILKDWMDPDDQGIRERSYYERLQSPRVPPNRVLHTWNELASLDGWKRDLFDDSPGDTYGRYRDARPAACLTLIPTDRQRVRPININTASRDVLIGIFGFEGENQADRIVALRSIRPIRSIDTLAAMLDNTLLEPIRPYLDVRSVHFLIETSAFKDNRSMRLRILARRGSDGQTSIVQTIL